MLSDKDIRQLCRCSDPMIEPFSESQSGCMIISYGLSSAGYDIRLGGEVKVYKNTFCDVIDPKKFGSVDYSDRLFDTVLALRGQRLLIPPRGYVLGTSYERFNLPDDIVGVCVGKSTLARVGVHVNVTPLEPGWRGQLTIEISNANPSPVAVYPMEGIAQIQFFRLESRPECTYAEKSGKYQHQQGVTLPIVR